MVNSLNIIWKNICINICIKKRAQKVFSDYLGVVKLSFFAFAFFCAFPNVKQWNMCYFLIIRIYKCYFKSWIKTTCSERTGRRIWQRSTKIGFWWNWKARSGQGIGLTAPLPSTANRLGVGGLTTPDPRSLNSAPLSYPPCPLFCTWIPSCCQLRLRFCVCDLFLFSDCWSLPKFPEVITRGNLFPTPLSPSPAVAAKSLQSCLTLFDPMGCSLSGPSVHGVSPGKNAMPSSKVSSQPRVEPWSPAWQADSLPLRHQEALLPPTESK